MRADISVASEIVRSARVAQVEGLFDIPPTERSELRWTVDLPLDERPWNIGLIVGASGSGKSTVARHFWRERMERTFDWPRDRSLVDAFPKAMGIKEIVELLCSVGFSSPPSWMRPFHVLSNGEQFRVSLARLLAEMPEARQPRVRPAHGVLRVRRARDERSHWTRGARHGSMSTMADCTWHVLVRRKDENGVVVEEQDVTLAQLADMIRGAEATTRHRVIADGYSAPLDTGSNRPPAP